MADLRFEIEFDSNGEAVIRQLRRETGQYTRTAEEARREQDQMGRSGRSLSEVFTTQRLAIAAAAAGLVALGRSYVQNTLEALEYADAIGKTADRLGVGVEALQEYRVAASLTGVETAQFDAGLERFVVRISEAAQGSGEAKDALEDLGIPLRDRDGQLRSIESLLADVADRFAEQEDSTVRAGLAYDLFGRSGVGLVNTLRNGSAGLEELRAQARATGQILREDTVRSAEALNDRFTLASDSISVAFRGALVELAPVLVSTAEYLAEVTQGANQLFDALSDPSAGEAALTSLERQLEEVGQRIESIQTFDIFGLRGEELAALEQQYFDLLVAIGESRQALEAEREVTEDATHATENAVAATAQLTEATEELTDAQKEAQAEAERIVSANAASAASLSTTNDLLRVEIEIRQNAIATGEDLRETETKITLARLESQAAADGLTEAERELIRERGELLREQDSLEAALDTTREGTDMVAESQREAILTTNDLRDAFGEMITGLLRGTRDFDDIGRTLGDFAKGVGATFFQNLLFGKQQFDQTLIGNVTGLVGPGGIIGNLFSTGGQQAGQSFFGNLTGSVGRLFGGGPVALPGSGLLNAPLGSLFGAQPGTFLAPGLAGPTLPNPGGLLGRFGGATLGSGLLGAGAGYLGGTLGQAAFGLRPSTAGSIGSGLGSVAGLALGGPIGALLGSFFGSGLGFLGQPTRISLEKRGIDDFFQDVVGVNTPGRESRTGRYLGPARQAPIGGTEDALSLIGVGYALAVDEGGLGTVARVRNQGLAGFGRAGLSLEEGQRNALQLAGAVGIDDPFALINRASLGGFDRGADQFTRSEVLENVRENEGETRPTRNRQVRLVDVVSGGVDLVTGFDPSIDSRAVARNVVGNETEQALVAQGRDPEQFREQIDAIRDGSLEAAEALTQIGGIEFSDLTFSLVEVNEELDKIREEEEAAAQREQTLAITQADIALLEERNALLREAAAAGKSYAEVQQEIADNQFREQLIAGGLTAEEAAATVAEYRRLEEEGNALVETLKEAVDLQSQQAEEAERAADAAAAARAAIEADLVGLEERVHLLQEAVDAGQTLAEVEAELAERQQRAGLEAAGLGVEEIDDILERTQALTAEHDRLIEQLTTERGLQAEAAEEAERAADAAAAARAAIEADLVGLEERVHLLQEAVDAGQTLAEVEAELAERQQRAGLEAAGLGVEEIDDILERTQALTAEHDRLIEQLTTERGLQAEAAEEAERAAEAQERAHRALDAAQQIRVGLLDRELAHLDRLTPFGTVSGDDSFQALQTGVEAELERLGNFPTSDLTQHELDTAVGLVDRLSDATVSYFQAAIRDQERLAQTYQGVADGIDGAIEGLIGSRSDLFSPRRQLEFLEADEARLRGSLTGGAGDVEILQSLAGNLQSQGQLQVFRPGDIRGPARIEGLIRELEQVRADADRAAAEADQAALDIQQEAVDQITLLHDLSEPYYQASLAELRRIANALENNRAPDGSTTRPYGPNYRPTARAGASEAYNRGDLHRRSNVLNPTPAHLRLLQTAYGREEGNRRFRDGVTQGEIDDALDRARARGYTG